MTKINRGLYRDVRFDGMRDDSFGKVRSFEILCLDLILSYYGRRQ